MAGFLERGLPLRAVHLDIDYMRGYRVFTVDEGRYPDLQGLVRGFQEKGVRTVLILDPGVKAEKGFPPYEEGLREGLFCRLPSGEVVRGPVWPGLAAFPDFTDPKARAWWGEKLKGFLEMGVAGFWLDMNEPALFAAWGSPPCPQAPATPSRAKGGTTASPTTSTASSWPGRAGRGSGSTPQNAAPSSSPGRATRGCSATPGPGRGTWRAPGRA